jgi:hypothetical protein
MRHFYFFLLFAGIAFSSFSQADSLKKKKKQLYFSWGYTRAAYSKSTLHFKNTSNKFNEFTQQYDNYDFVVYDAVAKDRPDFDKIKDVINITVPQYVGRLGYTFNNKWGIELNYDHTKYVVTDWQKVRVKGRVNNNYFDQDTILDPNTFLHFEHTDGANFWMVNAVRRWDLLKPRRNFEASWVLKPGAGVVIPRTDVTLFGERLNNNWHVAGWIVGVESGLRLEFFRYGFFEFTGKGSYADYTTCLVLGKGNGKAKHHFFTGQLTATLGVKFGSKK